MCLNYVLSFTLLGIIIYFIFSIKESFEAPMYKLAFYTCFYGDDENIAFKIPLVPSIIYDCYYYTNNLKLSEQLKNTQWKCIYDETQKVSSDSVVSAMQSKYLKTSPDKISPIQKYDYICYFDSKIEKITPSFIEKCIKEHFINENYALILKRHDFLNGSVWNEYNESQKQERYVQEKHKYLKYIYEQMSNGLTDETTTHCNTGILLRNMKHPKIIEINNVWNKHVQECGIECQISFHFIKEIFKPYILPIQTSFID